MTPDDVRLTAQLVVGDRVHCVSDAAVKALAARVLELEADAEEHAEMVRQTERDACAKVALQFREYGSHASDIAAAIRYRGLRSTPTLDDVKRGGA